MIAAVALVIAAHRPAHGGRPARPAQRAGAVPPAGAADRPHPPAQPRRPQRGAARRARRPGHQRHRDAGPVLPVGRAGLVARRPADAAGRRRDARLRLGARRSSPSPSPRRWRSCCASCSATSSRAYDQARERNGEMLAAVTEVVAGAETIRAYDAGDTLGAEADAGRSSERAEAQIRAGVIGAFLFPSGEVFSVLTSPRVIVVGVVARPGQRADGRGDDRLHLPHLPVPRTDRRVHRGARPDPDRGRRAAAGARRARHARSVRRPPPLPCRCRAGPLDVDIARRDVRLPDAGRRHVRRRRGRAARRRRVRSRPASRWRWSARPARARRRSAG